MQGQTDVIAQLNVILKDQLTAINQTFLHARMLNNWGFNRLGKTEYHHSIKWMKDADKVIERILFLEGLPNLQNLDKLMIGEDVPEILKADFNLEQDSRKNLLQGIAISEQRADFVTRHLLNELLEDAEERLDFYETQLDLVKSVGVQNYLQSAMGDIKD